MKKIDSYDYKILSLLDENARMPASQIARYVRLSKVSVNKRIKKLEKKGIINNYLIQVNYRMLGYSVYHVYYNLQNISNEGYFYSELKKFSNIAYLARIDGLFDVFVVFICKNVRDLYNSLLDINKKFGAYIHERNILLLINSDYLGRRYLSPKKQIINKIIKRDYVEEIKKLDKLDACLLSLLSENARMRLVDVAHNLSITTDIVRYRLKKLLNGDILQKFTININNELFGNYFFKVLIKLNYNSDKKKFISNMFNHKNLVRSITLVGSWDLELDFELESYTSLREVIKDIKNNYGKYIQSINPLLIYHIDKLTYFPFECRDFDSEKHLY